MESAHLSKTDYLRGLQCPKQLWIHCNEPALVPPATAARQAILAQGHKAGSWAKRLFPGGIDLAGSASVDAALAATRDALKLEKPLFEAAASHGRCWSRADILDPVGGGFWDLIEVKSSTEKKEVHLHDVAFQRHVWAGAGVKIRFCHLLLINSAYVRRGPIEPGSLFCMADITRETGALLPAVESQVNHLLDVIALSECPPVRIGPHCAEPFECPLKSTCWSFLPRPNVFDLRGGGRRPWTLFDAGILRMEDIPADFELTGAQQIQASSHRSGRPHVDREAIRQFLESLRHPLHFLDFETFQFAIPPFDLSRPYSQIPFQFSLHTVPEPGADPVHHGFLAEGRGDPRAAFMAALRGRIGNAGSIVAYNTAFEIGRLRECAEFFPEFEPWVDSLVPRFIDLFGPFRAGHYYHPAQHGSASLKAVLPVLTGTTYDGLEIREGGTASREFLRITFGDVSAEDRARVRDSLEIYCAQDTRSMIEIVAALEKLAR